MKRKKQVKEPDFDLVIRVRNNHLVAWRESLGMSTVQAAEHCGVPYSTWIEYESIKTYPLNKKGDWRPSALKLSAATGKLLEELWPEAVRRVQNRIIRIQTDAPEFLLGTGAVPAQLPSPEDALLSRERLEILDQKLKGLTPDQERRIRKAYGIGMEEKSLHEIAEEEGRSCTRITQVVNKGLRTLRHKSTLKDLEGLLPDPGNRYGQAPVPSLLRPPHFWRGNGWRNTAYVLLDKVPSHVRVLWYGLGEYRYNPGKKDVIFEPGKTRVCGNGNCDAFKNYIERHVLDTLREVASKHMIEGIAAGTDQHGHCFWVKDEECVVLYEDNNCKVIANLYPREDCCLYALAWPKSYEEKAQWRSKIEQGEDT